MAGLKVDNLSCRKGGRLLLSGLSFELAAASWIHLRGANGVGKTTLLRTLAGLAPLETGAVTWAAKQGSPVFIGHQFALKREFNAIENLQWGIAGHGMPRIADVRPVLARMGLHGAAEKPVRYYSEGQKRRLTLARLLLTPASPWLLDEPLNGLDQEGVALFGDLLQEHLDRGGMAIVTSHQALPVSGGRVLQL